jgi:hypothetical protein
MKQPILHTLGFAPLGGYGFCLLLCLLLNLGFTKLSYAQNCQLSIANGHYFECDSLPAPSLIASKDVNTKAISSEASNKPLAGVGASTVTVTVALATSNNTSHTPTSTPETTASKLIQNNSQAPEKLLSPASVWEMRLQDITLAQTLQRWSQQAGWKLIWDVDKHIMIDSPHQFKGSFEEAISLLLAAPSLAASGLPLEVCFYPNTPPLARITRKGEQDKECI